MIKSFELLRSWPGRLYLIALLALLTGLTLSVISWMQICSQECAESHNWRLFGLPFEFVGFLFFIPTFFLHLASRTSPDLSFITGLLISAGVAAEIEFIRLQKYQIGVWCPVCLSIACALAVAAVCYAIKYGIEIRKHLEQGNRGELMTTICKGIAAISVFLFGFLVTLAGVAKIDPLLAQETTLKESLSFGNKNSTIEVYLFTDWACPACRQLELEVEKMTPAVMAKAKLTFVDHAIHPETLNYSPYNVSFMIKNKPQYLKLRHALTELSTKTSAPTEEQVEELALKQGVKYHQLNYSDVKLSQNYFEQLGKQLSVTKTPTLVITNSTTKKGKRLVGIPEITQANVLRAIDSLQTKK